MSLGNPVSTPQILVSVLTNNTSLTASFTILLESFTVISADCNAYFFNLFFDANLSLDSTLAFVSFKNVDAISITELKISPWLSFFFFENLPSNASFLEENFLLRSSTFASRYKS